METATDNAIKPRSKKQAVAYIGIVFVVIIWGLYPIFTSGLLERYSGGIFTFVSSLIAAVALLPECVSKFRLLDRSYFKVAVPTGLFVGVANLMQKIGLRYTTPTQYAFLENLSCVVVPLLLFLFIRKKLAGVFYGVNIAATGVYATRLNAMLYVMIQMWVNVAVSGVAALALHFIRPGGVPIEAIEFSWDPKDLLILTVLVLSISTFGWIIRTEVLKYVNASAVAVIMPFSSVVTGVVAVAVGRDAFAFPLLLGGLVILLSSILSSVADIRENKRKNQHLKEPIDDD